MSQVRQLQEPGEELDALLDAEPIADATLSGAAGLPKCRRHTWTETWIVEGPDMVLRLKIIKCLRCGTVKDEARSRRGRTASNRGKRIQRERIVALGGRNLAGNNPNHDGIGEMFSYESKSGAAAFSDRYWRWLRGIPVNAGQSGVLIVTDAPGPGHKARSYVVVEYDEWRELHGE